MPNKNSIVARVTDPVTIEQAREQGFTVFAFYPTLAAAKTAAIAVELANMPHIKAVAFQEVFEIEDVKINLNILGQTPRPKPKVSRFDAPTKPHREATPFGGTYRPAKFTKPHHGGMCPDCGWFMCQCPLPQHNAKLDAFAIWMGEWAAKIRNAVR